MTLGTLATMISLGLAVGAGSFWGYEYQQVHKPYMKAHIEQANSDRLDRLCKECRQNCHRYCKNSLACLDACLDDCYRDVCG